MTKDQGPILKDQLPPSDDQRPMTKDQGPILPLYRGMQLIRQCEEQLARSHQRGLIHGACHTYVGQEAIAVGVCGHLRREDVVFSTHRGHGHALAKGMPPRELFAELFGRGKHRIALHVDSQSLTGATRLYERAGMHVVRESHSYELVLREGREIRPV